MYKAPICYNCNNATPDGVLSTKPLPVGKTPPCKAYLSAIPKKIYFENGSCKFYDPKVGDIKNGIRKRKKS